MDVVARGHFRHGEERTNNQPGDPSASLLLTSVRRQSFAIPLPEKFNSLVCCVFGKNCSIFVALIIITLS